MRAVRAPRFATPSRAVETPEETLEAEPLPDVRRWPKAHRDAVAELCHAGWRARPASSGSLTMTPPDGSSSKRVSEKTDLRELRSWQRRVDRGTTDNPTAEATAPAEPADIEEHDAMGKIRMDLHPKDPAYEAGRKLHAEVIDLATAAGWEGSRADLLGMLVTAVHVWHDDHEVQPDREAEELLRMAEGKAKAEGVARLKAEHERDEMSKALDRSHAERRALLARARAAEGERDAARAELESLRTALAGLKSALG